MKHALPLLLAAAVWTGCGSDPGANSDPAALESAFKSSGDETIETPPPAEESTTDTVVIPVTPAGEVPIKEVANRAAAAMRKDDVTEAMVLLQTLRRAKNLSPDQMTAVQDQMAALQSSLASRAENGDLKAKQALELMRQSTRW